MKYTIVYWHYTDTFRVMMPKDENGFPTGFLSNPGGAPMHHLNAEDFMDEASAEMAINTRSQVEANRAERLKKYHGYAREVEA